MRTSRTTSVDAVSVVITLVVIAIVVFVGFQVMGAIDQDIEQQLREEEKETITVCGLGCGGAPFTPLDVIPIVLILVVIVGLIGADPRRTTDPPDDVEQVKQLYIEGEIDILELENRLDEELDDDE